MVELCNKGHFDKEGVWHKCGLPVEHRDPDMPHVHTCGLPSMKIPLDTNGACRYCWYDPAELNKVSSRSYPLPPKLQREIDMLAMDPFAKKARRPEEGSRG